MQRHRLTTAILRRTRCEFVATLVGVAMLTLGCGDSTGPAGTTGSLRIIVSTESATADRDPDGYTVSIDGGPGQVLAITVAMIIADLPVGKHLVQLDGVTSNCSVGGANPRSIDVVANRETASTITVVFVVSCVAKTA